MANRRSGPNLLLLVADGWKDDELSALFGKHRITIAACKERPGWSREFQGTVFEVQTLYGEYGGFIGGSFSSLSKHVDDDDGDGEDESMGPSMQKKEPRLSATRNK
ncbi:MAG TPA: hypothetical protein VGJ26_20225, partial [Pirellulales bacterium]